MSRGRGKRVVWKIEGGGGGGGGGRKKRKGKVRREG